VIRGVASVWRGLIDRRQLLWEQVSQTLREHLDDAAVIAESMRRPEAFAGLYDRHAAAIHRFAARRLGDQVADDILAETFLAAFRRRERYDPGQPDAGPWLYGIAVKLIGKHRRSEVRMLRAWARTGVDPVAEADVGRADDRLSAAGVQRELAAALATLSPGDRHVLLLIAWGELSYEQAATALEIPIGTVRSRLSRARRKVREALGGRHPVSLDERGALL
jgi:RNA polymerase sigma factor (sigma-70 family)